MTKSPSPPALAPLSQAWERFALLGFPEGLANQDRGAGGEGKRCISHLIPPSYSLWCVTLRDNTPYDILTNQIGLLSYTLPTSLLRNCLIRSRNVAAFSNSNSLAATFISASNWTIASGICSRDNSSTCSITASNC